VQKKKKPMNKNKKFKEQAEAARLKAQAAADTSPSTVVRRASSSHADEDEDDDVRQPVEYPDIHIVHHAASASRQDVSERPMPQDGARTEVNKKHTGNIKSTMKKRSQMFAS
jgi:hypothetical protein